MEVINGQWFCVKTVKIYESAVVWVMNARTLCVRFVGPHYMWLLHK